ncbi:hypothetical protein A2692_00020 [Candidatus Woesebacteria bacterium RIFCSPHIGHO2_01_FULL_39_95]|nr:MAG: hypothetical protein A2692_00020 [Candidatus Woesebacteria bacterium RIFCSPHIGHO2_01_FULL_39_95]OGM75468.1 MAG: hypothetical protein A3H19_03030 [Candidatus Woesebacteria bacterium RIFCSPLOWO2_12_FULL_39_9]
MEDFAMSHKPEHIENTELAPVWDELYAEALAAGVDAESAPVVVKDESRRGALEALAAVGGATVTDSPEGMSVQLAFEAEEEGEEHEADVTAAAKPHTFADEE